MTLFCFQVFICLTEQHKLCSVCFFETSHFAILGMCHAGKESVMFVTKPKNVGEGG